MGIHNRKRERNGGRCYATLNGTTIFSNGGTSSSTIASLPKDTVYITSTNSRVTTERSLTELLNILLLERKKTMESFRQDKRKENPNSHCQDPIQHKQVTGKKLQKSHRRNQRRSKSQVNYNSDNFSIKFKTFNPSETHSSSQKTQRESCLPHSSTLKQNPEKSHHTQGDNLTDSAVKQRGENSTNFKTVGHPKFTMGDSRVSTPQSATEYIPALGCCAWSLG